MHSLVWSKQQQLLSEQINEFLILIADVDVSESRVWDQLQNLKNSSSNYVAPVLMHKWHRKVKAYVLSILALSEDCHSVAQLNSVSYHQRRLQQLWQSHYGLCEPELAVAWRQYHHQLISCLQARHNRNWLTESRCHAEICRLAKVIGHVVSHKWIDHSILTLCNQE